MLGYDIARLHSALNDLPPALLPMAVLFDLLGAFLKRESLKAAGFWTLLAGVLGTGGAIVTGLLAEDATPHGAEAHAIMETHETLAFIVLGLFAILAIWRLMRKGVWSEKEQPVALTAGVIGVALIVVTAMFGGRLVFEHGVGIPTPALEAAVLERSSPAAMEHVGAAPAPAAASRPDSAAVAVPAAPVPDSAKH
ncbi:MAG: DUF2231 domain-containing protein [Gemmatimonadales bacterium]|jgi:uncharacterized membrane protein